MFVIIIGIIISILCGITAVIITNIIFGKAVILRANKTAKKLETLRLIKLKRNLQQELTILRKEGRQ